MKFREYLVAFTLVGTYFLAMPNVVFTIVLVHLVVSILRVRQYLYISDFTILRHCNLN